MAGKEDQLEKMQNLDGNQLTQLPSNEMPRLPEDVKKRFPSMREWEKKMEEWVKETNIARGVGKI